ncbi:MAG: hypothetical protein GX442_11030 [Candidatus Riflebacteria bacterium]|nr:hypothetical protein [Candidatus Riflebacteria bacterium]
MRDVIAVIMGLVVGWMVFLGCAAASCFVVLNFERLIPIPLTVLVGLVLSVSMAFSSGVGVARAISGKSPD